MNIKELITGTEKSIELIKANMSKCTKCNDGWIKQEKDAELEKALSRLVFSLSKNDSVIECDCRKYDGKTIDDYEAMRTIYRQKLTQLQRSIPETYIDCDISEYNADLKRFIMSDKLFCWLYGNTGTGKTYSVYNLKVVNL